MDYVALGQRIYAYRKKLRLTQEQLAEMAEVSPSFLGHIERGSRVASLDTFMRICHALQVTPNDLLAGEIAAGQAALPELITISPAQLLQGMAQALQEAARP